MRLLGAVLEKGEAVLDRVAREGDKRELPPLLVVSSEGSAMYGTTDLATILDRNGRVVDVVFSGQQRGDQWPGSRVISAQKANTANAFSLEGFALSTANLFAATQPGGSLFGLQESNPVDTDVAYAGPVSAYGKANDPMIGKKIGMVSRIIDSSSMAVPSTT